MKNNEVQMLRSMTNLLNEESFDSDTVYQAKAYGLDPRLIDKMRSSNDHFKMIYMWVKQGHIDLKTFKKLLDYSAGV